MLLALTDRLRCTEPHAETPLVARADVVDGRRLIQGVLGCPVCLAERLVQDGIVFWNAAATGVAVHGARPTSEAVMRVGALLGLADSALPYVLGGAPGDAAAGLAALADAPLVLLDPPDDRDSRVASIVRGAPRLPLGPASARGIAVDAAHADAGWMAGIVPALVTGGRLVAPAGIPVPPGVRELARDDTEWVAERAADVVPLTRAQRPG